MSRRVTRWLRVAPPLVLLGVVCACGSGSTAAPQERAPSSAPRSAAAATTAVDSPTVDTSSASSPTVGTDSNPTGDAALSSLMCDAFAPALAQAFIPTFATTPIENTNGQCIYEWQDGATYGDLTFSREINARETAQQYVDAANARSGGLSSSPIADLGDNAVSTVYTEEVLSGNGTSVSTGVVWARGTDLYVLQYRADSERSDRSAEVTRVAQGINRALG